MKRNPVVRDLIAKPKRNAGKHSDKRAELEKQLALLQAKDDLISKAFLSYRESVLAATAELANIFKPIKPESEDER
jgi:hypothetical protein